MFMLFLASLIKNLLVKTVYSSYYLKLSLPVFLKCFLIVLNFGIMFLIEMFLIKENVYCEDSMSIDERIASVVNSYSTSLIKWLIDCLVD